MNADRGPAPAKFFAQLKAPFRSGRDICRRDQARVHGDPPQRRRLMSRDLARLLRAYEKFGIVLGSRDVMALDLGRRGQFALHAADALAAARSPGDLIACLQQFRHAVLRRKLPAQCAGRYKVAEAAVAQGADGTTQDSAAWARAIGSRQNAKTRSLQTWLRLRTLRYLLIRLARFDTNRRLTLKNSNVFRHTHFSFQNTELMLCIFCWADLSPPRPGEGFVGATETRCAGAEDRPRAKAETQEVFLFGFAVTH